MFQLHKRQHPDYKYQPRRRRGQGADSPSIGGKGVFHFRLKFLTSSNKFYFSFPEEPLTPPHTPSEEDRLRQAGRTAAAAGDPAEVQLSSQQLFEKIRIQTSE